MFLDIFKKSTALTESTKQRVLTSFFNEKLSQLKDLSPETIEIFEEIDGGILEIKTKFYKDGKLVKKENYATKRKKRLVQAANR